MRTRGKDDRPDVLEGAALRYAPENELGVVYLFAQLAKRWRIHVDLIRSGFPDCIAYRKVRGREERIRIEFEYRSRNFKLHGHRARECDWIVCWEHNWSKVPPNLEVIELRREFGLGFNVWILASFPEWDQALRRLRSYQWSLPSQAHKDDLVLMYITRPEKAIKYVYRVTERPQRMRAGFRKGLDYRGSISPVCRLAAPIFFEDLSRHRVLRTAGFTRAQMQGRPNAMEYRPYLHELIVRRNPAARRVLKKYAPENL